MNNLTAQKIIEERIVHWEKRYINEAHNGGDQRIESCVLKELKELKKLLLKD